MRLEQPLKAPIPIVVTEFGIVADARLEHIVNALFPILSTVLGIVTDVRLLQ